FSPPDQTVDIRGRSRNDGYTLAIIDSGLGMPPADIEAANRRLAGAESFTIAPSKYLGHYVAGNLGARHGIRVRLDASPGNGITATVNIPPALLTTEAITGGRLMPPDGGRPVPSPAGAPIAFEPAGLAAVTGPGIGAAAEAPGAEAAGDPWRTGEYQPAAISGWPAPTGLSAGTPPPEPAASRTQSGLVKRARTNGAAPVDTGPGPGTQDADAAPGSGPGGDLLAALRRHSANLQGVPGMVGQPPYGAPASARGPQAVPPGPPSQPLPPTGRQTSGAYEPTGRHDRVSGDDGPRGPLAGEEPTGRAADIGGLARRAPTEARGPGGSTEPAPPASSRSRLTRRVRGAQMPDTSPLSVRRTTGEHPVAPHPPASPGMTPGPTTPPTEPDQLERSRAADDVYSFLTSFTAGVQRGLDDARGPSRNGEDNGGR
ncbi:MAG: hypothetical protein ACRDZS_08490, partial [Acidimicrobiales bacterium]